jgi:two-component system, NtrC family, sensor kinase
MMAVQMTGRVRPRILAAMTLLLLMLGVASWWAWHDLTRIDRWTQALAHSDAAMHRTQAVGVAMRDAYAHQAHMIILGDRSHLDHYTASYHAAQQALGEAQAMMQQPSEHEDLQLVARALNELDGGFRREVLPLASFDGAEVAAAHGRAVMLVESAQATLNRMDERLAGQAAVMANAVQQARQAVGQRALWLLLSALLVFIVAAVLLDRQIAVPVQQLARGVQALRDGAWTSPVSISGNHELAQLGAGFNDMATELQRRQTALLAAERLAGIGRLAAGVAHELNNPLAVMHGHLQLLRQRSDLGPVGDDIAVMTVEVARCQHIIAGLLELAKPQRMHMVQVDVVQLLREAGCTIMRTPVTMTADDGKLMQVIRNLVQNARDAAPSSPVDAEVDDQGAQVVMRIGDRGPGVAVDIKEKLFEPFTTTKPQGTGLGLAISRTLAHAHGGTLQLMARDGGGTWAVLSLPHPLRSS